MGAHVARRFAAYGKHGIFSIRYSAALPVRPSHGVPTTYASVSSTSAVVAALSLS